LATSNLSEEGEAFVVCRDISAWKIMPSFSEKTGLADQKSIDSVGEADLCISQRKLKQNLARQSCIIDHMIPKSISEL
jgi:hypothetical protein